MSQSVYERSQLGEFSCNRVERERRRIIVIRESAVKKVLKHDVVVPTVVREM